jgi:hypothetical protein
MKKILTIHLSVSLSFFNLSLAFFLFSCSFGFFFILFLPLIVCSHITYAPVCNIYIYMYIYIYPPVNNSILKFLFSLPLLSCSSSLLSFCQQLHLFSYSVIFFSIYPFTKLLFCNYFWNTVRLPDHFFLSHPFSYTFLSLTFYFINIPFHLI